VTLLGTVLRHLTCFYVDSSLIVELWRTPILSPIQVTFRYAVNFVMNKIIPSSVLHFSVRLKFQTNTGFSLQPCVQSSFNFMCNSWCIYWHWSKYCSQFLRFPLNKHHSTIVPYSCTITQYHWPRTILSYPLFLRWGLHLWQQFGWLHNIKNRLR